MSQNNAVSFSNVDLENAPPLPNLPTSKCSQDSHSSKPFSCGDQKKDSTLPNMEPPEEDKGKKDAASGSSGKDRKPRKRRSNREINADRQILESAIRYGVEIGSIMYLFGWNERKTKSELSNILDFLASHDKNIAKKRIVSTERAIKYALSNIDYEFVSVVQKKDDNGKIVYVLYPSRKDEVLENINRN